MGCIFCNKEEIKEDIIHETDNFYVKVGMGIIAAGQVMIVPKKHYLCFVELPDELWGEYQQLKNKFIKKITEKFAEPFLVEYGACGTIEHAHIHIIPKSSEEYQVEDVKEIVDDTGLSFEVGDRKKLIGIYNGEGKYVLFEEKENMFICHVLNEGVPRGHRSFFAKKGLLGVKDWKTLTKEEKQIDEEKRNKTKLLL